MYKLKNNPILLPHQIDILRLFFQSPTSERFFFTGGTALSAFYLAHRRSEDLDFFTLEKIDPAKLRKTISNIQQEIGGSIEKEIRTRDYWELYLRNAKEGWRQRLDFVHEQPIVFGEKQTIDGVRIDSLENIASNKILTLYGRLEAKDYLDLYFIIKETDIKFHDLFEKTKQKDSGLHEFYFANIIADVDKIDTFPPTLKSFSQERLVAYYQKLSQELLDKIKPPEDR